MKRNGAKFSINIIIIMILLLLSIILPGYYIANAETKEYKDFRYKVENNEIEILLYYGKSASVTVPGEIRGTKVVAIGDSAFESNKKIKTMTIQSGVQRIGSNAFRGCKKLESIILPDTLESVDGFAFYDCSSLKDVDFSPLKNKLWIGYDAFSECKSLLRIILTNSVRSIGPNAFNGCVNVKELIINDNIQYLDENAFNGCPRIKEVNIPNNIQSLPYFADCDSLEKINISKDNQYYTSVDGVIYNKDCTTIVRYPPARKTTSYNIPNSVTTLREYAFSGLSEISELTIPDTVINIGEGMFFGSPSIRTVHFPTWMTKLPDLTFFGTDLTKVIVPKQIIEIGYRAYAGCKKLKSISIHAGIISLENQSKDAITGPSPFYGCDKLEKFKVDPKNEYYKAIDNVLFYKISNITQKLICYPPNKAGKTYYIPKGTMSMYDYAFYKCNNLTTLYLPKSMGEIISPFRDCTNLKIMVPATTTYFLDDGHSKEFPIFTHCTNCYLYVKPKSVALQYCNRNGIPCRFWRD